jgi:hypothetical protein
MNTLKIMVISILSVMLIPFMVFLRPVSADTEVQFVLVCTCGKPAYIIMPHPGGFRAGPAESTPELDKACRSGLSVVGVDVWKTETVTGLKCPIGI